MEIEHSYEEDERTKNIIIANVAYFKSLANKHKLLVEGANDMETLNDMLDLLGSGEGFYDSNPSSLFNSVELRKIIIETLVVEYWDYFFKSDATIILPVHKQIRNELLDRKEEEKGMPIVESSTYKDFKQWVSVIFGNYNPKIMYTLYFAKFHHCSNASGKLNILLYAPPNGNILRGVSGHKLHIISNSCPSNVVIDDYDTALIPPDLIMVDRLMIKTQLDIVTNDDARNNFKEIATGGGYPVSISFYIDENGDRKSKLNVCTKCSVLASTCCNLENADPNFISRFIVLPDTSGTPVRLGTRPEDKIFLEILNDVEKVHDSMRRHRYLHKIYYLVQGMINDGVIRLDDDGARLYMHQMLDEMQQRNPTIITTDVKKRAQVFEMSKCMCISYAVWCGLFTEETRHLQYDPITKAFVGFNPRVLGYGILPRLVVTREMVEDAVSLLECLWINP